MSHCADCGQIAHEEPCRQAYAARVAEIAALKADLHDWQEASRINHDRAFDAEAEVAALKAKIERLVAAGDGMACSDICCEAEFAAWTAAKEGS